MATRTVVVAIGVCRQFLEQSTHAIFIVLGGIPALNGEGAKLRKGIYLPVLLVAMLVKSKVVEEMAIYRGSYMIQRVNSSPRVAQN